MKELIEEAVLPQIDWHLEVIPLSIVNMKEVLPKIQEDYEIIGDNWDYQSQNWSSLYFHGKFLFR